jgi:hypothetical protein
MIQSRYMLGILLLLAGTAGAQAAINGSTGSYVVAQGGAISTVVTISDTSAPEVSGIEGMVFTYQIDGGAGSTPWISSIDLLTGTVWAGKVSAANVLTPAGGNLAQYQSRDLFTDTIGDVVNANGTLARVTISAATAPLGVYTLKLTGTKTAGRDSALLNGVGETVPATFTGGTLTIATNGDATLDGKVDAFDLNALAANWQSADNTTWATGDFNHDGKVDAFDLNALAAKWQFGVGGSLEVSLADFPSFGGMTVVPEPASVLVVGQGVVLLMISKRLRRARGLGR